MKDYCSLEGFKPVLTDVEISLMERWFHAANYLSVGQVSKNFFFFFFC